MDLRAGENGVEDVRLVFQSVLLGLPLPSRLFVLAFNLQSCSVFECILHSSIPGENNDTTDRPRRGTPSSSFFPKIFQRRQQRLYRVARSIPATGTRDRSTGVRVQSFRNFYNRAGRARILKTR